MLKLALQIFLLVLPWAIRRPLLNLIFGYRIDPKARIVHRNLIDCTDTITIGEYTVIAGWRNQLLTHSIDIRTGMQSCGPIKIGRYCFTGTGSIFLKNSSLPDYCVLGAGSVLNRRNDLPNQLYSGVPAVPVRALDPEHAFFTRTGSSQ